MQQRMEKHFGVTKCTGGVTTDQTIEKENMKFTFSWTLKNGEKKESSPFSLSTEGSKRASF